ncbi:MAG TPA: RelA/SpoT domain-containing protein [Burkholderiaceae bacterium]
MDFAEYENYGKNAYSAMAEVVAGILAELIRADGRYRLQQIMSRAKTPESLLKKLRGRSLESSMAVGDEIKDLAGCRVIFYTNTDVTRLLNSGLIHENFEVVDYKFHHPEHEEDDAELYTSNHFVVRLNAERLAQSGFGEFAGMRCEIQVQTILNHAWAEMAHDTIYKAPELDAMGTRTLDEIKARMRRIAREYLVPAGFEFQKIASDFDRLLEGKTLADEKPLDAIVAAVDNNERFDALLRFKDVLLPLYDNMAEAYPVIVDRLIAATEIARSLVPTVVETPFGSSVGKTFEDVLRPVSEILTHYRYVDPLKTFSAALALNGLAQEGDEAKAVAGIGQALAKFHYRVASHGVGVQAALLDKMDDLGPAGLAANRRMLVPMLSDMLGLEVSGTSHHASKITFHRGTLPATPELKTVRARAVRMLKALFVTANTDAERQTVLQALRSATQVPYQGGYSDDTQQLVMNSAAEVLDFQTQVLPELSLELKQSCETWAHRLYHIYVELPQHMSRNPKLVEAKAPLVAAAQRFKDAVNADPEYVIFKLLVGYDSVFPPAWDDRHFQYMQAEEYRHSTFADLIVSVTEETAEEWFQRLNRFSRVDSRDLATFPAFSKFLGQLAEAKPAVVIGYLTRLDGPLKNFLPEMLNGVLKTDMRPQAIALMDHWLVDGVNLSMLAWQQRVNDPFDEGMLQRILRCAMATGDMYAVSLALTAAADQFDKHPGTLIAEVFLPGLEFLAASGQFDWLRRPWTSWLNKSIVESMDEASSDRLLQALLRCPDLEQNCEYIVASVAKHFPVSVLRFIGERVALGKTEAAPAGYEPVPFSLYMLPEALRAQLEAQPELLLHEATAWYRADELRFPFSAARVVVSIFPAVDGPLAERMMEIASLGGDEALAFLLALLEAYGGNEVLYPILRTVVGRLAPGCKLLRRVGRVMDESGVVHGEFGFVELNQARRRWLQPWLEDACEKVRAFADARIKQLDDTIALETRSAEISVAMRRMQYGEDVRGKDD